MGGRKNLIAILDANTLIFLALFESNNLECYDRMKIIFTKIFITPEVFREVFNNNKFYNYSYLEIDNLDDFIYDYEKKVREFINYDKTEDLQDFIKKATDYHKRDGEFYSTSLALHCSRYDGDDFNEFLLKTFIITDDEKAKNKLEEFYNNNLIGRFLTIIDLFTLFYVLNLFTKENYLKSFEILEYIYSDTLYQIINAIKLKKEEIGDSDKKGQLLLTNLLQQIDSMNFDEISKIINDNKVKRLIPHHIKLLEKFIAEMDVTRKIYKIKDRLSRVDHIYKAI